MAKSTTKTSQRFSRAARAERDRLAKNRLRLFQRREALQANIDKIDQALEAVDKQLLMLEDFAESSGSTIEIREVDRSDESGSELLSGSLIRALAVPLLIREHGFGPIHYRDWYALLNREGYAAAGKRPDAVFLNQIARSPLVRPTTRSGYYTLDLSVIDHLREKLRQQQSDLGALMNNVPADSASLEEHRRQQRELSMAISRTERDLSEAVSAVEAAERAAEPAEVRAA